MRCVECVVSHSRDIDQISVIACIILYVPLNVPKRMISPVTKSRLNAPSQRWTGLSSENTQYSKHHHARSTSTKLDPSHLSAKGRRSAGRLSAHQPPRLATQHPFTACRSAASPGPQSGLLTVVAEPVPIAQHPPSVTMSAAALALAAGASLAGLARFATADADMALLLRYWTRTSLFCVGLGDATGGHPGWSGIVNMGSPWILGLLALCMAAWHFEMLFSAFGSGKCRASHLGTTRVVHGIQELLCMPLGCS